jgi:hypothetical protein
MVRLMPEIIVGFMTSAGWADSRILCVFSTSAIVCGLLLVPQPKHKAPMSQKTQSIPQEQLSAAMQSTVESSNALASIVSDVVGELLRIQSETGTAALTAPKLDLARILTPQGWSQLIWQAPSTYYAQTRRFAGTLLDSYSAILRGQQQLVNWSAEALSDYITQTENAMSKINATIASRRLSAEIIHFSDRRAKTHSPSESSGESANQSEAQDNTRAKRQAAA